MELLFESRLNVLLDFVGHVNFVQVPPTIHPEPVIVPDTFADGKGVSIYGTVLRDGGRLRMWYYAHPEDTPLGKDGAAVAYAESDDGLHWDKPVLNLVECGPGPNHLVNLGVTSATVFVDPDSPPSHRYRATGVGYPDLFMCNPAIQEMGYYTAHSADGLHWQLDSTKPRWYSADDICSVYHPQQRRAIITMKFTPRYGRILRRSIHAAEFRDGEYSDHVSALYPDEFDDVCAAARGHVGGDYYNFGMLPAGMGTAGFLTQYWHDLPYTCGGYIGLYGVSDVTLAYQADPGGRWVHLPGRPNFIDHAAQPWMNGWINTSSCPVEMGDEHWLYFAGRSYSHGFCHDPGWQGIQRWEDYVRQHGRSGIGFARWPKWRLFGFESDPEGSFVLDLGPVECPSELVLNCKARPGGAVRVELAEGPRRANTEWAHQTPIPGRTLDDAVPLAGDSIAAPVAWADGTGLAASGDKHVYARIHLDVAGVYAYELRPIA